MSKTVYDYMDWPEIEAVVYGEETAPRDVMGQTDTGWCTDTGLFSGSQSCGSGYRAQEI